MRVWDLATGNQVGAPFTGHTGYVQAVATAQLDGRTVVISGGDDSTVRVWDLATRAPVGAPFTGHTKRVVAVTTAQLRGRTVVVSGGWDDTVRVWDLATGAPVGSPFTGHTDFVCAVATAQLGRAHGGDLRRPGQHGAGVGSGRASASVTRALRAGGAVATSAVLCPAPNSSSRSIDAPCAWGRRGGYGVRHVPARRAATYSATWGSSARRDSVSATRTRCCGQSGASSCAGSSGSSRIAS